MAIEVPGRSRREALQLAALVGGVAAAPGLSRATEAADPFACGLAPADDLALTGPLPEDPKAVETYNVWLHDADRGTGVNLHPYLQNGVMTAMATFFLPDGRILRAHDKPGTFTSPSDPHGATIQYHCDRPFHGWSYQAKDLPVFVTTVEQQKAGVAPVEVATTKLSFEIKARTRAPIWMQGVLLPEAKQEIHGLPGKWMGNMLSNGPSPLARRYDQALSGEGVISFEGKQYPLSGHGLRGHVRGVRVMDGMEGHTWIGAVFESGMCVGIQCYPRVDGGYHYSEAYIYKDGEVHPNRVIYVSRLNRNPHKDAFVAELACDALGLTRITGEDHQALWWAMAAWGGARAAGDPLDRRPGRYAYGADPTAPMLMKQALATFDCNGERGVGMQERSGSVETSET